MPRRTAPHCRRRSAPDTIDTITELVLLHGHAWGVAQWEELLQSRHAFTRAWATWGEELVARWRDAYPGSRPLAAYVVGEIEDPTWEHQWPALRHPVRLEGRVVIPDRAWHQREVELQRLDQLGLLDDDEYAAAIERLDGPDPTNTHRYRPLAEG